MLANVIILYTAKSGYDLYRELWSYDEFQSFQAHQYELSFLKGAVINGKTFSTKDWSELESKLKKVRKWENEIPYEY